MADTTNVILAAGPTVVALAAIGSAVWQQRRSFVHERALADRARSDAGRAFEDAQRKFIAAAVDTAGARLT